MSDAPTHTGGRAVFLSYAREDADSVRRIADALRAFGVEVWFDQHELRGGDQWDAKIRGQIKACTLFVPIISHQTETRTEGYFRREWKLAVDRTHDMASSVAFIVPVAIDETPESGAAVPEEFGRYHWTRLPGGVPSPEFVAQVKRLLESPRKPALKAEPARPPTLPAHLKEAAWARAEAETQAAQPGKGGARGWTVGVLVAVVVGIGTAVWVSRKPAAPARPVESPPPVAAPSASVPVSAAVLPVAPAANPKSIAVLPFANLSADKDNEYFADGMHDEVITALAKVRDLTVISRTSVQAYRKTEGRNLRRIGAELGVASVLEGSVQRAGDRVKVIVQLIDATSDRHVWAETYVENVTDVFTIQSKLAGAITAALKATLSPEEKSLIAVRPTDNPAAYEAYLQARTKGIGLVPGADRALYEEVVGLLEKAVALDPNFTRAQAELCYTNGMMYWFGSLDPTPARRARAKAALDAIPPQAADRPEARMARAMYLYTCENDWAAAQKELSAAETSLPNDALIVYLRSITLRRLGRVDESIDVIRRAIELSPQDVNYRVQFLISLQAMHRLDEWEREIDRALARFPQELNFLRAKSLITLERDDDRAAFFRRTAALPPAAADTTGLAKAYYLAWYQGDLDALDRVLTDPRFTYVPGFSGVLDIPSPLQRALVAHLRGRSDEARQLAEAAKAILQKARPTMRQEPWHLVYLALADALAGRGDEAVRQARAAIEMSRARDRLLSSRVALEAAAIHLLLHQDDEALALAKAAVGAPCEILPQLHRMEPVWKRLNGDPRFEELLRSIQPL